MSAEEQQPAADAPRPRRQRWFVGLAAVVLLAAAAALAITRPWAAFGASGQEPATRLTADAPSVFHPDGLVLRLTGDGEATVSASTLPREALLAGETVTQWDAALDDVPPSLTPLSPLYRFRAQGGGPVQAEIAIPNDARPFERLSIYGWDGAARGWAFVPSQIDEANQILAAAAPSSEASWMVFRADPPPPVRASVVRTGDTPEADAPPLVLLAGLFVGPDGALAGEPAAAPQAGTPAVLLIDGRSADLPPDSGWHAQFAAGVGSRAANAQGVVLDVPLAADGYADLLGQVRGALPQGATLGVVVRPGEVASDQLPVLAQAADTVWLASADPTAAAEDGALDRALAALTGQVVRGRVGLLVTAQPVAVTEAGAERITLAEAAAQVGTAQAVPGYLQPDAPLAAPRGQVPVQVSGPLLAMGVDSSLGAGYLTFGDDAGNVTLVYVPSAESLTRQAEWAARYGLGTVAVDATAPDAPQPPAFVWRVSDATGSVIDEFSGGLAATQWVWSAPQALGAYTISAALQIGGAELPLGEIPVEVTEDVPAAPSTTDAP